MENIPDDILPQVFITPACMFVCSRFYKVLENAHSDGLLDFWMVRSANDRPEISRIDGRVEINIELNVPNRYVYITYGKPILVRDTEFRRPYYCYFRRAPGSQTVDGVNIVNAVGSIKYYHKIQVLRLIPTTKQNVSVQFTARKSGELSSVIKDSTSYSISILSDRCVEVIDKVVPWNTRTWPMIAWMATLRYMNNVVTRKMYHRHFAGILDIQSTFT